ncbi:MAG: transposase [Candidatus Yonathbacteria bacterium]|nr:transposase [Candidatus Yonathbacteria bacterium]
MTSLSVYHNIKGVVSGFSQVLHFGTFLKKTGRKLALSIEEYMSMALFKQMQGIETKKQTYEILEPPCSYKTFVVNVNRWAYLCALILVLIMKMNRKNQHPIKHIDSTNIPVCLFKNANAHKTMKGLATFGRSSKGTYFGLKLHIISDFRRKLLSFRFTAANGDDREMVMPLSAELWGILIGDAGYISAKIAEEFHQEGIRRFLAKPRQT